MTEFENILEQCLLDLELGASSVEECLGRHPGHALQLEPVLLTHTSLAGFSEARPSAAFKARVRARLTQQMQAHPRKSSRFNFVFMRFAANLAVVILALLATATAYAQSVLPGNTFYAWKLTSEDVWRAVSSDPVRTDLAIADRRMNELIAVRDDPVLYSQVLEAYLEVTARLKSEINTQNEALILQTLDSQVEELNESGIPVPQIIEEDVLPPIDEILPTLAAPIATLLPVTEASEINPTSPAEATPIASEKPQINPTALPNIAPTIQSLPNIVPTIQVPPNIVPTIQLPDIVPTIQVPTLLP